MSHALAVQARNSRNAVAGFRPLRCTDPSLALLRHSAPKCFDARALLLAGPRLDLAAEIYHLREPQKIPLVMSPDETRRLLAVASSLKVRVLLSLGYGCGLAPAKWCG